jgi:hypothetical protein
VHDPDHAPMTIGDEALVSSLLPRLCPMLISRDPHTPRMAWRLHATCYYCYLALVDDRPDVFPLFSLPFYLRICIPRLRAYTPHVTTTSSTTHRHLQRRPHRTRVLPQSRQGADAKHLAFHYHACSGSVHGSGPRMLSPFPLSPISK